MSIAEKIRAVSYNDEKGALILLDQTLLPNETKYLTLHTPEEIWEAIYSLRVRGAPSIGVAAGYGIYTLIQKEQADSYDELYKAFTKHKDYLASSRPTAVNLFWALNRMDEKFKECSGMTADEVKAVLRKEAEAIYNEDVEMCIAIGKHGLSLLKPGMGLITHCNAGTIACSKYGTALSPMYLGQEQGYDFKVFADETRPLLQGARLTAWELHESGIDVTLICDNMASIVMKNGWVNACLVGCDRVAANGDAANKIGTSMVAILAKHYGIPFYVLGPTSTIDMDCKTGEDIEIELRKENEISEMWYEKPMAPQGVKTYNPAFDVTSNELITAIVTEHGVIYPPFDVNIKKIMQKD